MSWSIHLSIHILFLYIQIWIGIVFATIQIFIVVINGTFYNTISGCDSISFTINSILQKTITHKKNSKTLFDFDLRSVMENKMYLKFLIFGRKSNVLKNLKVLSI